MPSKTNSEKSIQFKDADVSRNLLERHFSRMIGEGGKLKWSKGLEAISVNYVLEKVCLYYPHMG